VDKDLFDVQCPCCGTRLEIDTEIQAIVHHQTPKKSSTPKNLSEGIRRVKAAESDREGRFLKQLSAQQKHDENLENRFQGLLKKVKKTDSSTRFIRDIDLD
tara:strand:- start:1342 stop:1644 length:303 start_codon:yes stop_codon:yes gene_type:complete